MTIWSCRRWIVLAVFAAPLIVSSIAEAQPQQPARSGARGSEPKPREPVRGGGGSSSVSQMPRGWILSYTPAKAGDEEDLIGVLKLLPEEKGSKVLTLQLVEMDKLEIRLGEGLVDKDQLPEFLLKNLYCSVQWENAPLSGGKKNRKVIKSITLEPFELKGTVEEIGEDYIVVRAKPMRGVWPEEDSARGNPSNTPKAVKAKKLRLRTAEKFSKFLNRDNKPGDSGEYTTGDPVEIYCAYGKTHGILLTLKHPTVKSNQEASEPKPQRGPVAPPPPRGGRRSGG